MVTSPVLLDITGKSEQHLPGTNRGLVAALRTRWQHLAEEAVVRSLVLSLLGKLSYTCYERLADIEAFKTSAGGSFVQSKDGIGLVPFLFALL